MKFGTCSSQYESCTNVAWPVSCAQCFVYFFQTLKRGPRDWGDNFSLDTDEGKRKWQTQRDQTGAVRNKFRLTGMLTLNCSQCCCWVLIKQAHNGTSLTFFNYLVSKAVQATGQPFVVARKLASRNRRNPYKPKALYSRIQKLWITDSLSGQRIYLITGRWLALLRFKRLWQTFEAARSRLVFGLWWPWYPRIGVHWT